MLNKVKNSKGFTIIEVMIVLAIAGLIILVVLLAVPAVQRSGRNTAIKSDASAIAGGISEFASNNNGGIPTAAGSSCSQGSVSLGSGGTSTPSTPKIQGATLVNCVAGSTALYTVAAGTIEVEFGVTCPNTVSGTTVTPVTSPRSTAIIYGTETSSGVIANCLSS